LIAVASFVHPSRLRAAFEFRAGLRSMIFTLGSAIARPLATSLQSAIARSRAAAWALSVVAVALSGPADAQQGFPSAPNSAGRNPACPRLESQLALLNRGGTDPARAEQIRRLEDTSNRQKAELDRMTQQARRGGCEGSGFFSLFSGQPPQCSQLNGQIQQMRANIDRTLAELQQAQGGGADREAQRRGLMIALGQNDCGPQYRAAVAQPRDFFESLFGPSTIAPTTAPGGTSSDTYRTLCVRTCDGYFFPVSYSTVPSKFADDERVCQRMCPAADVMLYSHRNPGEDVAQAVSSAGRQYSDLPSAFAYRKQFNPSCSCKAAGQTWAEALKSLDDQTVERGDIVVTEERAKQLSQPQTDAQGKPIRPPPRPAATAPGRPPAPLPAVVAPAPPEEPPQDPAKRKVRTVGPTFLPAR
jgi:hypothetical protein